MIGNGVLCNFFREVIQSYSTANVELHTCEWNIKVLKIRFSETSDI